MSKEEKPIIEDIIDTTTEDIIDTTTEDIVDTTAEDIVDTTVEDIVDTTVEDIVDTTVEDIIDTTAEGIIDTTAENIVDTTAENTEIHPTGEAATDKGFEHPEQKELDIPLDQEQEYLENDLYNIDLEDIQEVDDDPLEASLGIGHSDSDGMTEPEVQTTEEIKEKVSSPKNNKNIKKLGGLLLKKVDQLKAKLCSNISGNHMTEYLADEEMQEVLLGAVAEYLESQEFKAPTPFGTLMLAIAMWALPPIGMAVLEKYEIGFKKPKKKSQANAPQQATKQAAKQHNQAPVTNNPPQPPVDYSHLKEFQNKRKNFSLNKEGKYKTNPKGRFIASEHSDYPSTEVKQWLDEGYSGRQIRNLLAYGE